MTQYYNPLSILKVLMAVGIIYIHVIPPSSLSIINAEQPDFNIPYTILTETLMRNCVPLYFFISAFMFFQKNGEKHYIPMIILRGRRLLIPFFIYNTIFIFLFIVKEETTLSKIIWLYISPANFPLWFLRDLFLMSMFVPIIKFMITNYPKIFPIVLFISYLILSPAKETSIISTFVFFSLGAYMGQRPKIGERIKQRKHLIWWIFIIVWGLDVIFHIYNINGQYIIHTLFKLIFICTAWCILDYINMNNPKNKFLLSQSNFSFFLYCTHMLLITSIYTYFPQYYLQQSLGSIILVYLLTPLGICVVTYISYTFFQKACPYLLSFSLGTKKTHSPIL
ncbi:acyltransferase [uncultured Bacteroides sp.]|uniref:acyltransferase n=1 Tax=uncultured Bacteroides sp. TaxID=162156 RepID=UPI00338E8CB3